MLIRFEDEHFVLGSVSTGFMRLALAQRRALGVKHGAATFWAAAAAGIEGALAARQLAVQVQVIIVRELFARFDVADGVNVDVPAPDDGAAIGIAGVIDEAGLVAAYARIHDGALVQGKEKGVRVVLLLFGAPVGFARGNYLAGVFDDAGPRGDRTEGEGADAVYTGASDLEIGL